jgi:hypothetical protein
MKALTLLEWKLLQWMATPYGLHNDSFCSFLIVTGKARFCERLKVGARKAAMKLVALGYTSEPDRFGNIRLNEKGIEVARVAPKPAWRAPKPSAMAPRDWDVLNALRAANREIPWARPLDCEGSDGSFHSASLVKLTHHGYAECRQRGGERILCRDEIVPMPRLFPTGRGSRCFRITPDGIHALIEWHERQAKRRAA